MNNFKLIEAENLNEYSILMFNEVWQIKEFENIKIKGFKLATKYLRVGRGGVSSYMLRRDLNTL